MWCDGMCVYFSWLLQLQEHSDDEVEVKSRKGGDREDKPR